MKLRSRISWRIALSAYIGATVALSPVLRSDPLGTTSYFVADATDEEVQQVTPGLRIQDRNQIEAFQIYSRVVQEHSGNRAARLFLVQMLIQAGSIQRADNELLYLKAKFPNFRGVMEADAKIGHVLKDRRREAGAYRAMVRRPLQDLTFGKFEPAMKREFKARAMELEGQGPAAVAELRGNISDPAKVPDWDELGHLELRLGHYAAATNAFEEDYRAGPRVGGVAEANLAHLAIALWAVGNRKRAFHVAMESCRLAATSGSTRNDDSARTVLEANLLARSGLGTREEQAEAKTFLNIAAKCSSPLNPNGLYSVIPAVLDEAGSNKEINRLSNILRVAPGLDWALWAALFLYKQSGERAKGLLRQLPTETIQGHLARESEERGTKEERTLKR